MATGKNLPRRGPQGNGGGLLQLQDRDTGHSSRDQRGTSLEGLSPSQGASPSPRQGHWPSIHPSIRGLSQLLRLEIPRAGLSGGNRFGKARDGGVLAACPTLTQRQAAGGTHGRPEAVHLRVLLSVRLPHHLALHNLLAPELRQLGHGCGVAWPGSCRAGTPEDGGRAQGAERLGTTWTNDSARLSQRRRGPAGEPGLATPPRRLRHASIKSHAS